MFKSPCFAALLGGLLIGASGVAQTFSDPFSYTPGTNIPGYTEQRGDWKATGTEIQADPTVTFQELTFDKITDLDCCVETLAIYDANSPALMYTGPLLRHTGQGSTANYIMIKLQDNGSPYTGYDRGFTYYCNGSSFSYIGTYFDINPPTQRARVRLQAVDIFPSVQVHTYVDTDLDGKWDIVRVATIASGFGQAGKIGVAGYRNALADDLKFFDAALWLAGTPQIGTAVKIPGRGQGGLNYLGACSFSRTGIPIDSGRSVPLTPDALFFTSLLNPVIFQNFQGSTGASGDFTMVLNIPNLAGLVGVTIYSSAITYNALGVAEIAPDVEVTFTP
jgi:hypothetical protein